MNWDYKKSKKLYKIDKWGNSYYNINEQGFLEAIIGRQKTAINLYELILNLRKKGLNAPVIIRFPQIIKAQIQKINNFFQKTIKSYQYKGNYQCVYPIKVNQERHIIESVLKYGEDFNVGLECGSKSELLIALAFSTPQSGPIICNGFKDEDYIKTILLSQKIGLNIIIVIDRMEELDILLKLSKELEIKPQVGLRIKLDTTGSGKWVDSSGTQSKFGLTSSEIVLSIEKLKKENLLDQLIMIHFHIGSQINSIQFIKNAIREGAYFFTQIYEMGAKNMKIIDVGGGLGVDYDGSSGVTYSSINYTVQEYVNDVVCVIQDICNEKNIPHPDIISESGRFLVAHSSLLIFEILGQNKISKNTFNNKISNKDSKIVQDLYEIYENLTDENINESYNDLISLKHDTLQLFSYGKLTLSQRAKAEDIFWSTATAISEKTKDKPEHVEIFNALIEQIPSTYYGNFSVFQSLPDSWALRQTFPILPIQNLQKEPNCLATIVDLTCDSDGKINTFIDSETEEVNKFLNVHELTEKPYFIGTFLIGAYQEILGDIHNLFGDTNMVEVESENQTYKVISQLEGDSTYTLLDYLEYKPEDLVEKIRKKAENSISQNSLSNEEAQAILKYYKKMLLSYTYLKK